MRRVAFSMTIDPDGAMHDWVDLPDSWRLIRVPTQEAVHLIGIRGYQELLVDLCRRERPDVLVTHPPYDYLTPSVADDLGAFGVRLVAYAFDDDIFAADYDAATRDALARIYDRYVTTRDVRWATAPAPAIEPVAPAYQVALVGRAYPRRVALVQALRAAGINVATRGVGWPEGFVSRGEMRRVYARSSVILTTADWETRAVPMVKHRLLDTAMMGMFQVAQAAPDLRNYFSVDEVPSFSDANELVTVVREALAEPAERRRRALAARKRVLEEHTWHHRFAELIHGVPLHPPSKKKHDRSSFYDAILMALATRAEADGRLRAALALFSERLARDIGEPTAAAGMGRCLRDLGDARNALPWFRRAAGATMPVACGALHARIPAYGVGTGLGRLGLWPPSAEPTIMMIAALVELGRIKPALAILEGVESPALGRALAATITLGDGPELAPLREALERLRAQFPPR